jgi:hypothetical protein
LALGRLAVRTSPGSSEVIGVKAVSTAAVLGHEIILLISDPALPSSDNSYKIQLGLKG